MTKKVVVALAITIIILLGTVTGIILVRQRQEIREKAAVPTGQATVSISPSTGTFNVGEDFTATVSFNTAGIPISAVATKLTYPYSGSTPEISATIEINSALLTSGDWTCPIRTVTPKEGLVNIDIACVNTTITGFEAAGDTTLATIRFTVNEVPATNPTKVSFDPEQTIITRKSDGTDIALTPSSQGVYTISGGGPTASPTASPSPSPTAEPTAAPTVTPSPTGSASPKPLVADINDDGKVNILDYVILFENFQKSVLTNSRADINDDGKVNILDYVILFENFGRVR